MNEDPILTRKHRFRRPEYFIKREDLPRPEGITLICCCAGSGKTVLLSQLCEEYPDSACISLGYEDDSPERIVTLLGEAIPSAGITAEDDGYTAVRKAAASLSEKGGLLLIDNAHCISSPRACSLLSLLAQAALDGSFVMAAAARSVPAYLSAFVTEDRVNIWSDGVLCFSASETERLAEKLYPEAAEEYLRRLSSFTGGWCIAAAALLRADNKTDLQSAAESSYLPEYIKHNILDPLNDDLQQRLLMSALLQDDDELYREGLRLTDMESSLNRLAHMGILWKSCGSELYPPVMRSILSQLLPEKTKTALTEQASDFYIRRRRFAEAIRIFEESGNARAAESILTHYGDRLLSNCEFELIGYCGRIIGGPGKVSSPDALGALAQYYYYTGDYQEMEQAFNRADSMFGKENQYSVLRRLYKGLLRYEKKPGLYSDNVRSSVDWLREHDIPLPFLYRRELDVLEKITHQEKEDKTGNVLFIRRFGPLRLNAGTGKTEIQCKTKRSAELLAYMLEQGERPVGRDRLLEALWWDEMPANAVAMLHNMIYHLRRELTAFGLENVIIYKNKTYSLDMKLIQTEDGEITDTCKAAESGSEETLEKHLELLKNYWGTYLGGIDAPWANERREYYDRCYVNACTRLAHLLCGQGRYSDGAVLLKNAYRIDPYSEQLAAELINCYSALGKPNKARRCYEDYSSRLDSEFGTRPSSWLRKLYFSCLSDIDGN